MIDFNLGRVQGAGIFFVQSIVKDSVNKIELIPQGIEPFIDDKILFEDGFLRNIDKITDDIITCSELTSLKGPQGIQGPVGPPGDQGAEGKQGADGESFYVFDITENGDLTVTYAGPEAENNFKLNELGELIYLVNPKDPNTTFFNLGNVKGPKGDPGGPPGPPGPPGKTIEIINDLTTGGIDKALSAEQGKVLNENKQPKGNYAVTDNINIFNAPKNIDNKEQPTVWFNTANGGRVGFGKEKDNSGTGIFFDQVAGTRRLNFRASATPGAMVWSQPEDDASLFFDVGGYNKRIALPIGPGTIALTKNIPKIENSLTSTSTTAALSAAQGKKLNDEKQVKLISGTNIKTINNTSILGEGNINTPDTNTWRPIYNGLDSTKTDTSLSANMGKQLNDNKVDKTAIIDIAHGGTGGTTADTAMLNFTNGVGSWSAETLGETERIIATTSNSAGTYSFKDLWDKYYKSKVAEDIHNGTLTITQNGVSKGTFTANQSGNTTVELTDNIGPTPNNGTLTIKQNGTSKGTFTANQSGNTTIELTDSVGPTPNNGTLTITQNGVSKGTFTANQSGNTTIALSDNVGPTPNNGTLTIKQNGESKGTFTANQGSDTTIALTNSIPNNGTLTIKQNGESKGTFTADQSDNKTIELTDSWRPLGTGSSDACAGNDNRLTGNVKTSGDQTISGNKTFSGIIYAKEIRIG